MQKLSGQLSGLNNWSLRAKVNLTVGLIFLFVITLVTTYTVIRENDRLLELAEQQTKDLTTLYFDSLNTMMLTGTMDQRDILRKKMLARPEVIDARVIRGEPVKQQFGPGHADEIALDDMDREALSGNEISLSETRNGQRVWTVLTPFMATENTRGVNCLQCHNVPSGSINGAIRVSYSLAHVDKTVRRELWLSIGVNLAFFSFGLILVNLFLRTWIINPLSRLINIVKLRSAGNINARVDVTTHDEIGNLSEAFNEMADNVNVATEREHNAKEELNEKVNKLQQAINKVSEGDYDVDVGITGEDAIGNLASNLQIMITYIKNSTDEKHKAVDTLRKQVDTILASVTKAANGDLTSEIEYFDKDEIGQLAKGVQDMTMNLNLLVSQVQRSGIQVASSATEIAATAKQQEVTVAEQAATTNQISTTATQISATSKELENTMEEVANIAEGTATYAASGQEGLRRMENTMSQVVDASGTIASKLEVLNEKASNINTVVTTINKVADQTNLLSLNAAIEAEKAGEYGFGFAVVAKEIRRLADQTAVATLDIEQMVKEMQSAVSAGVMSMEKFSEQVKHSVDDVIKVSSELGQIIDQVQTLTPRFESVHQSMHFQTQGAQQINHAMMQLSESAQQTVESLRQSNSAIEKLNEAASNLQHGVTKFKVTKDDL